MTVDNLDDHCPACERPAGDHTLREWAACLETPDHELPYEEIPADIQDVIRERCRGLDGYAIADHVTARAAVLDGHSGIVRVAVPALLLELAIGTPSGPIETAKVAIVAPAQVMRGVGRLIRDTANRAANRAEQPS